MVNKYTYLLVIINKGVWTHERLNKLQSNIHNSHILGPDRTFSTPRHRIYIEPQPNHNVFKQFFVLLLFIFFLVISVGDAQSPK